jgi:hypothetical protein
MVFLIVKKGEYRMKGSKKIEGAIRIIFLGGISIFFGLCSGVFTEVLLHGISFWVLLGIFLVTFICSFLFFNSCEFVTSSKEDEGLVRTVLLTGMQKMK